MVACLVSHYLQALAMCLQYNDGQIGLAKGTKWVHKHEPNPTQISNNLYCTVIGVKFEMRQQRQIHVVAHDQ